jgi:hypothetical protein
MAREIRVTIDDDEVFERMRARKRELDLSWEDVLHRGLGTGSGNRTEELGDRLERQITKRVEESLGSAFGLDLSDERDRSGQSESQAPGGRGPSPPASPGSPPSGEPGSPPPGHTADPSSGVDPAGRTSPGGLDEDIETLANAEDAVLRFPLLDDEPGNTVPLRVNLETSADGLDVDVVTIRTGKDAADRNAFERGVRHEITKELATGGTAVLELAAGVEEYHVVPVLSWSHEDGTPVVTDVEIQEVSFDA